MKIKEAQEKSLAEGHAEGHAQGEKARQIRIAQKMKKANKPLNEIAEFTELSIKEIEKL